jgi:PPOX class probable F420-dependent enzyme
MGTLYVRTGEDSGKVKRIRNNPRVRVMPCDMRGGPLGEWVEGQARFADVAETKRVGQLLTRKYGLQKAMLEIMSRLQGHKYADIAINV